jgi:hypothetical protein
VKIYGPDKRGPGRYSPPVVTAVKTEIHCGTPEPRKISTSYVERQNLTMRMSMRRFTRLTNAFSKKVENHEFNVALHFMHYNFCRVHQTLRVTPAMQAGLTDHVWELEELVGLIA